MSNSSRGRPGKKKDGPKRPQGRQRKQFAPYLAWTPEIEQKVMKVLDAAAHRVLTNVGQLKRGYVTKEDLVSNAWIRTFFYVRKEDEIRTKLYVWAQIEMVRYIRDEFGPLVYVSLDHTTLEEDPGYDLASGRTMDDPVTQAQVAESLEGLPLRLRKILLGGTIEGRTFKEMGTRRRRSGERIRQLYREAVLAAGSQDQDPD